MKKDLKIVVAVNLVGMIVSGIFSFVIIKRINQLQEKKEKPPMKVVGRVG